MGNLVAANSVVSDDIWMYDLVEESWMQQMFLIHDAAQKGDLAKIEDGRAIRKAFHALRNRSEAAELRNELYHEMQVRHFIARGNTRENANVIIALDPQILSLEPIGICKSCKNPQKLLDQYATQSHRLIICVECINKVVKSLIVESVAQGHTELVKNQFRIHFLIDWIYEANVYQHDVLMENLFDIEWLKVVEDVFRKAILGDKPDINGLHYWPSVYLRGISTQDDEDDEEDEEDEEDSK
jgi:hypothetical protein